MPRLPALFALVLLTGACAPLAPPRPSPLAGRIWDVAAGRFVERPALEAHVARARFVLLGEQHDNPEHHRLQAAVVAALVGAGRRPAVAFEMLTADQAPRLAGHLARSPRDAAGLGAAVDWQQSGWPPWRLYEPIARVALDAGLPLVAADLGRATKDAVRRSGVTAVDRGVVARTGLDQPLTAVTRTAMAREIREAHCGYAPEGMLDAMITAQRARDAAMADRLVTAGAADGAVLIAGAGHARRDWGVPAYLRVAAPAATVASLAFLEARGPDEPAAYAARFGGALPYDYVWFTQPVDDLDPCDKFRRSLERMRQPQ